VEPLREERRSSRLGRPSKPLRLGVPAVFLQLRAEVELPLKPVCKAYACH